MKIFNKNELKLNNISKIKFINDTYLLERIGTVMKQLLFVKINKALIQLN